MQMNGNSTANNQDQPDFASGTAGYGFPTNAARLNGVNIMGKSAGSKAGGGGGGAGKSVNGGGGGETAVTSQTTYRTFAPEDEQKIQTAVNQFLNDPAQYQKERVEVTANLERNLARAKADFDKAEANFREQYKTRPKSHLQRINIKCQC